MPFLSHKVSFAISIILCFASLQDETNNAPEVNLETSVIRAFEHVHDGWSSDEVILNQDLYTKFLASCKSFYPQGTDLKFGSKLLNLRKAGKLNAKTTRRSRVAIDSVTHIAEIVARSTTDRFQASIDRIMVTPEFRREFNRLAKEIAPGIDSYLVRRAAFSLRKARKLRPELIGRIVDWGRVIESYSATEIAAKPEIVSENPGIYIFRDRTGYLYIGQTDNLRERLASHLDESHNRSLSRYLKDNGHQKISIEIHSFRPDSRAQKVMVRRAYESELIASRKPRFNIKP